jgi:hypothetical protein
MANSKKRDRQEDRGKEVGGHIGSNDYKKHDKDVDVEKWDQGESDKRVAESRARQKEALHCAQT